MKNKRGKLAASEVVGTVLLLGIAIALFSSVQLMVFSLPQNERAPSASLVGAANNGNITISHHGGESLILSNTQIIFRNNAQTFVLTGTPADIVSNTSKGHLDNWDIGEVLAYNLTNITTHLGGIPSNSEIDITVVDLKSNSVVMIGTVKEGGA